MDERVPLLICLLSLNVDINNSCLRKVFITCFWKKIGTRTWLTVKFSCPIFWETYRLFHGRCTRAIFYSRVAMHRKTNVWAQRTIEFFDASQLVNKNRVISFRGMMFLFHENSVLFPYWPTHLKIGSERLWKYLFKNIRNFSHLCARLSGDSVRGLRRNCTLYFSIILSTYPLRSACMHCMPIVLSGDRSRLVLHFEKAKWRPR